MSSAQHTATNDTSNSANSSRLLQEQKRNPTSINRQSPRLSLSGLPTWVQLVRAAGEKAYNREGFVQMGMRPFPAFALAVALFAIPDFAADKKIGPAKAGNDALDITGLAILGKEAVTHELGTDPGMDIVLVQVRIKPKAENGITISRDDFTLISRKDGQKSLAMHPSQIAGSGAIV